MLRGSVRKTSLLKSNSINFLRNTRTTMFMSTKASSDITGTSNNGSTPVEPPQVLFTVRDTARVVTLNRPQKLNA